MAKYPKEIAFVVVRERPPVSLITMDSWLVPSDRIVFTRQDRRGRCYLPRLETVDGRRYPFGWGFGFICELVDGIHAGPIVSE